MAAPRADTIGPARRDELTGVGAALTDRGADGGAQLPSQPIEIIVCEIGRRPAGGDAGLALSAIGSLTTLVAEIAARSPKMNRDAPSPEKNATPARFRRQDS